MKLTGLHALVTGGGTGIGLAIARALATEGADVTISGRRRDVLEAACVDRIHPLVMDVSDPAQVDSGVARIATARGPVQICIANAGIAEGRALHKTSLEDWRRMMAINLDGTFLTLRACLPGMRESGWGRVIAISSIAGLKGLRGAAAYTASKHGMVGLIRGLSEDYLGTGLTFNAICPAYVDTEIVTRNVDAIAARTRVSQDEALAMMVSQNRHGRLISPDEIANAALWLCAPGSESVNGQTIEIAGGQV